MRPSRPLRDLVFTFVTFVFALSPGCTKKPEAKHYPLQGRIISVDKLGKQLLIDHAAIPGFMEAMTMPYSVADKAMLEQVRPGDEIKADLRVEGEHIVIEKLEVVKRASALVPERESLRHHSRQGTPPACNLLRESRGRIAERCKHRMSARLSRCFRGELAQVELVREGMRIKRRNRELVSELL